MTEMISRQDRLEMKARKDSANRIFALGIHVSPTKNRVAKCVSGVHKVRMYSRNIVQKNDPRSDSFKKRIADLQKKARAKDLVRF